MSIFGNSSTEPSVPTETPFKNNDYKFLIAPLIVIIVVIILSILVCLMARKRRMSILRHNLLSLYDFDSNEQEWEPLNVHDNPSYTNDYSSTTL